MLPRGRHRVADRLASGETGMHIGDEIGALQLAHHGQRRQHGTSAAGQHHGCETEHLTAIRGTMGTALAARQHDHARLHARRHGVVQSRFAVAKPKRGEQRMVGPEGAVGGNVHEIEAGEHRSHRRRDRAAGGSDLDAGVQRLDRRPLDAGGGDVGPDDQAERYALSRCTACGLCLEACPEVRESNRFVGAAVIGQARLFQIHPTGALHSRERTESLMEDGGVADCGKSQNCVEVCPAKLPLVDAIGEMSRATTKRLLFGWLLK